MSTNLTEKEQKERTELYQEAVARFLENVDFYAADWLEGEELNRYLVLDERAYS